VKQIGSSVGSHILADLYGVDAGALRDGVLLESMLRRAAHAAGARVLGSHFHSFGATDGVTGVVLLAESHISIHTWPESGLAAADIFMCGSADPERALALLVTELAPSRQDIKSLARGYAEPRGFAVSVA
jgi:S-adenosylmethionine decarboxylase